MAKLTLERYFRDNDGNDKPWLFPQLLGIAKRWLNECVILKDNTFPQLLLLIEFAHDATDRIYKAIVASTDATAALKPILYPYDTTGSTRHVDFDTTRPVFATRVEKCHISHVVADTDSWEQKMAEALEQMPEVIRYVKNHNLGFTIPYTLNGEEKNYIPDFIACIDDGCGPDDLLNLIVEVTGERKKDKTAKVTTARALWVPAINNHGGFWSLDVYRNRRPLGRTEPHPRLSETATRKANKGSRSWLRKRTLGRQSNPSATGTSAPTSLQRNCATSWPTKNSPPRPCSTRAILPSIHNWSGRARTNRTVKTLPSLWCRSTSRRRFTRRRSSTRCPASNTPATLRLTFFADFNGGPDDFAQKIDFYHHEQNWSNRLILGDSLLVMTSLAEKEGLKGKVQTIYLDPPYGIKFGSNWQVSTRKRDVKDGRAQDATRQPEQVRAFRDTWKLGIHSYLAYLRDRLVVARDLLTETGSVFVQIGDENVHLVRNILDEVFGSDKFQAQINFKSMGALGQRGLPKTYDYLLWYAKSAEHVKFRPLFREQQIVGDPEYRFVDDSKAPASYRTLVSGEAFPKANRGLFRRSTLTSSGLHRILHF